MTPFKALPSPAIIAALRKSPAWITAAALLALVAGFAFFGTGPAYAQGAEGDYVDLELILEVRDNLSASITQRMYVIVVNHGSRTAYDVEVVVDVESPDESYFRPREGVEPSLGNTSYDGSALRWTIASLGGLQREEFKSELNHVLSDSSNVIIFDNSLVPHELAGEVTTASFDRNLGNNTARVWSYAYSIRQPSVRQVAGNYTVDVSADNPVPSPGGTVNFTIFTDRANPYGPHTDAEDVPPPIDLKVDIELTGGLSVSGTPTYISGEHDNSPVPDSVSYSNGVFNIGTINTGDARKNSVTLPITVASDATVNEQCLTATLTGNPPPGNGTLDDDVSDNVATLCLDPPPEVIDEGEVRTSTIYACKEGTAANACNVAAAVDVRVLATTEDEVVDNATALIHVKDVEGRVFDSHSDSVTGGTTVSWQTATDEDPDFTGTRNGVKVGWYRAPINDYLTNWQHYNVTYTAGGVNGGAPPGLVSVRSRTTGTAFWALTPANSYSFKRSTNYSLSAASTAFTIRMFEFETLGTYVVDFTADLLHATIDDDGETGPDTFSGTGRTIYHVGPIAELGVVDGGVSAKIKADQVAFTVAGLNDTGETYESGSIVVELPAGTTRLTTIPAGTGVFDGNASPPTWTWDIHDLAETEPERRVSNGLPPYDPIILIVEGVSAGETATANVVYDPYEVCVASDGTTATATTETACDLLTGASWHSGTVFDLNKRNDSATLTARAGGNVPGTPALRRPSVYMPAVGFEWDEIQYLYGTPVKHYETEWSADGATTWQPLRADVPETTHVDTGITAGETRYYRVRAVNEAGVKGPWSLPMSAMVEAPVTATAGAPEAPVLTAVPNEPNGRTEILITWSKPVENGSAITSYTLQVADRSSGPWTDVNPQPGAADERYVYSDGLTGGTRKYFRMLATNMCDGNDPNVECDSLWSAVVDVTTRAPGISGAPTNVRAVPDGGGAIDVSWDPPLDDGGTTITRYEVQWSADGSTNWRGAGSTANGETLTFKNTNLSFGTTRYYRVAARNSRGLSDWSNPPYASATTLSGVPGQPNLTARATDANTIALTWTVPADNGSSILLYQLEWSEDGTLDGTWNSFTAAGASDTSYDDENLDPGTQRYYRIRAVNGSGNGSWSTVRNATTPPAAPGAPRLRATANGENAIDLTWDPPTDDGGADITGYELHVSTDGGTNYSRLTSPSGTSRSYTHGGLKPGDGRHYQIRARNRAGLGDFSSAVSASTLTGVPTAPSLTARANGATEIKLSWTKPDDKGSNIQRYELEESDDGNDWGTLAGIVASNSEYVHTGLSGGTTRYYRIRAVNGNGNGQWSTTRSARTDAGGPDAPVLTATPASDNQIDLSWTVPADNGSSIRGYWVERSVNGNAPWERLTSSNRTTSYSDSSLYRGMKRYYRVAAYNGAGTGAFSAVRSATTTGDPATAPSAPTLMRVSNVARGQVTLEWGAPADDGGAPVSGYTYQYSIGNSCPNDPDRFCFTDSEVTTTTGTSARITGLSTAGLYIFTVRAVNPVGQGELASARANMAPSTSAAVRVSPATFTVDEGDSFSYTIRLATAPPHPVWLYTLTRGGDQNLNADHSGRLLAPDGWTHPDPNTDWSNYTFEWDQGATVTRTANEDADTEDGSAVVNVWVERLPYDRYKPCDFVPEADKDQCRQDWNNDWADSPYVRLTGPSVAVTIRDDD